MQLMNDADKELWGGIDSNGKKASTNTVVEEWLNQKTPTCFFTPRHCYFHANVIQALGYKVFTQLRGE